MPDLSMCLNKDCPERLTCFRFVVKPSEFQTYASFEAEGCEYYWPIVTETKEENDDD
jgi:hypothetical protein